MDAKRNNDLLGRLGRRIAVARNAADLTQEALAEKIGRTKNQVSNIERAETDIPMSTFLAIAEAVGVSPAELFDWAPKPNRNKTEAERDKALAKIQVLLDGDEPAVAPELLEALLVLVKKKK